MAYSNTGKARGTIIEVQKTNNSAYPKDYSILEAFTVGGVTTPSITIDAYQKLSDTDAQTRLTKFLAYIEAQEPGITAATNPSSGWLITDLNRCPLS